MAGVAPGDKDVGERDEFSAGGIADRDVADYSGQIKQAEFGLRRKAGRARISETRRDVEGAEDAYRDNPSNADMRRSA